jgi:uncharacterized RDD family membrane protein YckC
MKCPKCYFIGFDNGQRCKNCGYQFSLSVENEPIELPLKTGNEPLGPLSDLPIQPGGAMPSPRIAASDLPLFGGRADDDDRPLVSLPASPRAPVAVRKASPAVRSAPPSKPHTYEPELDLAPLKEPAAEPSVPTSVPTRSAETTAAHEAAPVTRSDETASAGARLGAALIDLVLVLAIDAAVLYFTLKIAGLTWAEWRIIPPLPFLTFIAMLNGGYAAGATAASGQTAGKMMAGLKVVNADPDAPTDRVPLGQAILRSAAYLASALPAGLGFLPALIGTDRRALHDRLAHTRVVRA